MPAVTVIGEDAQQASANRAHVTGVDKTGRRPRDFRHGKDLAGDGRPAGGVGFENWQTEPFVGRGKDHQVRIAVGLNQLGVAHLSPVHKRYSAVLQHSSLRARKRADDFQCATDSGQCRPYPIEVLIHAGADLQDHRIGFVERAAKGQEFITDTVVDDPDFAWIAWDLVQQLTFGGL